MNLNRVSLLVVGLSSMVAATVVFGANNGPPFQQMTAEQSARAALEAIIERMQSSIPTLTARQEQYVRGEEAFSKQTVPAGQPLPEGTRERVMTYMSSPEYWIWHSRADLDRISQDLKNIKSRANQPARFAFWCDIAMQMSNSGNLAAEISMLRRLGLITTKSFGIDEGINWLTGPSDGKVQLLWPFLAQKMWSTWLYHDLSVETGASTEATQISP